MGDPSVGSVKMHKTHSI